MAKMSTKTKDILKTVAITLISVAVIGGVSAGAYAIGKHVKTPEEQVQQPKDDDKDAEKTTSAVVLLEMPSNAAANQLSGNS